jgi:hypothetical protein
MSGKPVYVDKTFSPDLASGARMFELAGKYGTPMFSSSALRSRQSFPATRMTRSTEKTLNLLQPWGRAPLKTIRFISWEMIVSMMGPGAKRVRACLRKAGALVIEYAMAAALP